MNTAHAVSEREPSPDAPGRDAPVHALRPWDELNPPQAAAVAHLLHAMLVAASDLRWSDMAQSRADAIHAVRGIRNAAVRARAQLLWDAAWALTYDLEKAWLMAHEAWFNVHLHVLGPALVDLGVRPYRVRSTSAEKATQLACWMVEREGRGVLAIVNCTKEPSRAR